MNKQGIESQYEDIIAVERLVAAGPAPTKQTPNFLNLPYASAANPHACS